MAGYYFELYANCREYESDESMLFSRKRRNIWLRRFLHACVEFGIGATYVYGQRFKAAREKSLAAMRRAKMIVLPRRTLFYATLRQCIFCGNYVSCHGLCKMGKHSSLDVCWLSTFSSRRLMLASAVGYCTRYSLVDTLRKRVRFVMPALALQPQSDE